MCLQYHHMMPSWYAKPLITSLCHLKVNLIIYFDKNKQLSLNKIVHVFFSRENIERNHQALQYQYALLTFIDED